MHVAIQGLGENITTAVDRAVHLAACPRTSSRVAVLIPLRSLRELHSISTT